MIGCNVLYKEEVGMVSDYDISTQKIEVQLLHHKYILSFVP